MGIIIGRQIDRFGPRPILVLGSLVVGLSLVLLSHIKELWHLYAVYLLMAVGWSGTSITPVNTLIANWFIRKRGQAMSLSMTGISIGGILLVPFATFLISRWGLMIALPILGALFWISIIPLALFAIIQRPSDIGQFPDGEPIIDALDNERSHALSNAVQLQEWTRLQAMRTMAFVNRCCFFFSYGRSSGLSGTPDVFSDSYAWSGRGGLRGEHYGWCKHSRPIVTGFYY